MRKKKILANIEIKDIANECKGLAHHDGQVVFVESTIPGDVVDVLISKKKSDYIIGKPIKFSTFSKERQEPFCEHFELCGGCKLQYIGYEQQLKYKQHIVENTLERIGKLKDLKVLPILACEDATYYRNKLEFTFTNRRWITREEIDEKKDINRNALGFHIPGFFDKVVDIKKCYLQKDPSNDIRLFVNQYALKNKLSYFDLIDKKGLLRNLTIRITNQDEIMLILSCFENDKKEIKDLLDATIKKFKSITSVYYVINSKANDSIFDLPLVHYFGKEKVIEKIGAISYEIGPKSFFQTNSKQAEKMFEVLKKYAGLTGEEVVYDLYSGLGSITLFLAEQSKKIIGVEEVEAATVDAQHNAKNNNINNAIFFTGRVEKIFDPAFMKTNGHPDVVITDPPRAGMHKDVISALLNAKPKKIVYVSCNPATLARDVNLLSGKYNVEEVQPLDMFPQTHHIENIALLLLR